MNSRIDPFSSQPNSRKLFRAASSWTIGLPCLFTGGVHDIGNSTAVASGPQTGGIFLFQHDGHEPRVPSLPLGAGTMHEWQVTYFWHAMHHRFLSATNWCLWVICVQHVLIMVLSLDMCNRSGNNGSYVANLLKLETTFAWELRASLGVCFGVPLYLLWPLAGLIFAGIAAILVFLTVILVPMFLSSLQGDPSAPAASCPEILF
jgi:hypothetical protein